MYKGPATRGKEAEEKKAIGSEISRIMTRGIPIRPYLQEENVPVHFQQRLSQCFDYTQLSALRRKILTPLKDRVEFFVSGNGFNIQVIIDDTKGSLVNIKEKASMGFEPNFFEDFGRKPINPLILHCALVHKQKEGRSGHALLLIYFPATNELDIVSTYLMDPEEATAIGYIVGLHVIGRTDLTVNDTMAVSGRYGFDNIQKLETPSVGWCVTWMAVFTKFIANFPVEFWSLPYGNPRLVELPREKSRLWFYRSMYVYILENKILGAEALQILADTLRSGGSRKTRRNTKSRKTRKNRRHV
jgi:hypothetical protein